jgi:hypothetical protein
MQSDPNAVTFVRPSTTASLFERVECVYLGNTRETLAVSVALSTVQHMAVQLRGLFVRDGWPEVCSDPENGRVALQTAKEVTNWLTRLVGLAPERFERLEREKAAALLSTTKEAREWAGVVAGTIVGPTLRNALREPFADLTEEQKKMAEAMMQLPLVVSSDELRNAYSVAVAAMIHAGDDAIVRAVNMPIAIDKIARLGSVPNELNWRIRLLVDRILMWADEPGH